MSVVISPPMYLQFFTSAGVLAIGYQLFTYKAGTSTKQATWTDSTQTVANANPIILDSIGAANVWLDPTLSYKFVLALPTDTDPPTSPVRTQDNIQGFLSQTALQTFLGLGQTAAELAAGVTPVNFGLYPGNVLRYGANTTPGTTNMTTAYNAALSQRQQGGEAIFFPSGLYSGNFIVTGQDIQIVTENWFYEDVATVGFVANNTANPVWSIGDGSTNTTSITFLGGLKMHGNGIAAKGLLFNGCQNVRIDGLSVRGFTNFCVSYTASTTRPTSYVFINNYRIDAVNGGASAIGLLVTQPANYPTSYATALFMNFGAIQAVSGTLWAVQINANSTIYVTNSYWSMLNNVGINFPDAGGTGAIVFTNSIIDTLGTSNDVLVTAASNASLPQHLFGIYTINGKVSINSVVSTTSLQGGAAYLGYRTFVADGSVIGYLDFQDSNASAANQTVQAQQAQYITRSGASLSLVNTAGAIVVEATRLQLLNAAGNADGQVYFSSSAITISTGSGSPAAAVSDGSLYLQTNAGASSPLWVRQNGAWVNVTLP